MLGLSDLPDAAGDTLRCEILRRWEWLPSVKEIRDLWTSISAPKTATTPDMIVARLYGLRSKHGAHVVPVKGLEQSFPILAAKGEPSWTDDNMRRVIAAVGGWVAFCEDESPSGVMRGQLLKIAGSVLAGNSDDDLKRMRIEYQLAHAEQGQIETPEISGLTKPLLTIADFTRV